MIPILVVAWGVTTPAWSLAQLLDVRIVIKTVADEGPCYVPERTGNDGYVSAYDSDYDFR